MFKQLHRKMMMSSMAVLVVFMLVVFTSLYLSVYTEVNDRIDRELKVLENIEVDNPQFVVGQPKPNLLFSQNLTMVVIIENDEVTKVLSDYSLTDEFIKVLYENTNLDKTKIELNDKTFAYTVKVEDTRTIINYLDITKDQELLQSSLVTYIIIFLISTAVTGLISHFLTKRNIKPIEESYGKQKEFVQNASHELKTPLTVINTNIDVLLSSKEYKDNKWLKYVKTEVKRMNKLTHDLLYLANNEEQDIIKTDINASENLESLLLGVEALAYEQGIELTYNLEEDIHILFNKEQYIQTVLILLDNAIKYTDKGNKIIVNLTKESKFTYITVKNTGEGIKEEDLTRLFDRFYKTDKSRQNKQNSYGLGLSIAKAIMDNHKGSISVSSEYGEYTEFELKIRNQ